MAARRRRHRRRSRHRTAPSASVVGYTRLLDLKAQADTTGAATVMTSADFPDVQNTSGETVNRKILRVHGQAFFSAALSADEFAVAQFALWAHPKHLGVPTVAEYDPFKDGPGDPAFEGLPVKRPFGRRTFVLNTPGSGVASTISSEHTYMTKAERLLRPGWVLSGVLYVVGSANVNMRWTALLRAVVSG